MATKSPTVKAVIVTVIPAVNSAWLKTCNIGKVNSDMNKQAVKALATIVKGELAPMTSISKSIKDTGKTSSIEGLTYSTIKGLPTWLALSSSKVHAKGFNALTLKQSLTFANKSYDLLGKGKGEAVSTWEDLVKTVDNAQAEKTRKAKEAKVTPKDSKDSKKVATLADSLNAMLLMVEGIEAGEIGDVEIDLINTIQAVLEQKMSLDIVG